jgi:hypothetical protein
MKNNATTITGQINQKAIDLLENNSEGIRWSEMLKLIAKAYPDFHPKTINGVVWKLVENNPDDVYKPEKGLFMHAKYRKS